MKLLSRLLMLLGIPVAAQAQVTFIPDRPSREQIVVDDMIRSFETYVPQGSTTEKMPVVIALHGGFASPKGMFHLADFRPLADKDKFIVVCPASKNFWHDGAKDNGIDDVKFIDHLITYVVNKYHGDASRVYITGISNGGFMAARLACQLANRIAAVAIVAATLDVGEGYDLTAPLPAMYIHGTKDPIVSYNGGKLFGRKIFSHDEILKKWVEMDKCNSAPFITKTPDEAQDGTSIIREEYKNPATGLKVIGYTIEGGGHTWPGGWQYAPRFIVGKTTKNLNACQAIWDFFKEYKIKS
jgi:polyhydroxybutyrate depolymerase